MWNRILVVGLFFVARQARAEPHSLNGPYSEYETVALRDAERLLDAHVDAAPEGKIIERIDVVRIEPIDRHDPLPRALDGAHTLSKPWVIRRNLLVAEGEPWRGVLVDESARNLRRLKQLSLVLCVAMAGSTPDRVRLVVITKDTWSLYVDFDLAITSGGLENLTLEPTETNIAGLHQEARGRFILEPEAVTLGAVYTIPRLEGRWLALAADANAIVNRETGSVEGGYGSVSAERPLFSSRTEWSWSSSTTVANRLRRRYSNARVALFEHRVPWIWRERSLAESAKLTRSFGWETKNDISIGISLTHASYLAGDAAFVRAEVPVGEDRVGPFVQWHSYRSDFLRTFDLDSLGLQEDQRLGHETWLRLYPVVRALGSSRDLVGAYAAASYGVALGDGIARAAIESTVEADADHVSDASVTASFAIATPRFGPHDFRGRFVFATSVLDRIENYLNAQSYLGGDTLLRGYPSRYLAGRDLVTSNFEYRTRSLDLAAIQVGAAAFYDVGDAFSAFDRLEPKQAVGGGLRIVFPQIDRTVLRFDLAVPVSAEPRPSDVPPVSFFVAFHHAVGLPTIGGSL